MTQEKIAFYGCVLIFTIFVTCFALTIYRVNKPDRPAIRSPRYQGWKRFKRNLKARRLKDIRRERDQWVDHFQWQ